MNENIEREQMCNLLSPSSLDIVRVAGYRVIYKEVQAKVTAGRANSEFHGLGWWQQVGAAAQLIGNAERIHCLSWQRAHPGKDKKNEAAAISFSEACKSARKWLLFHRTVGIKLFPALNTGTFMNIY